MESPFRSPRACLLAVAAMALLAGCERRGPGAPAGSVADLAQNLERARRVEVHVLDEALVDAATAGAGTLAARTGWEVGLARDGAAGGARIVIGGFEAPEVVELLDRLGVEEFTVGDGGLLFMGVALRGAGDALTACFEDPRRPGLPVALLAGGTAETLAPLLEDLRFPARPGARVYAAGEVQLELALALDGAPRGSTARDLADERKTALDGFRRLATEDEQLAVRVSPRVPRRRAGAYLDAVASARAALSQWIGEDLELPELSLLLADDAATMLGVAGRVALAAPAGLTGKVVALVRNDLPDDAGYCAAREVLRAALGPPAQAWMLDGAAIDAAGTWWGKPLRAALDGLGDELPTIAELTAPEAVDRLSMHVLAPARGLLFRYLRERLEGDEMLLAWQGECGKLIAYESDEDFRAYLRRPPREREERSRLAPGTWWKGLAIDSRVAPGGSLSSGALDSALSGAVAVGADALSFTSYALARPAPPFAPGGRLAPGLESIEGDAALAHAIAAARRRGVTTIALQPHLLAEESGGYWARRRRTSPADWDEFFAVYEPWLAHYAALAERTGCELLCIGTDLVPPVERSGLDPTVRAHYAGLWSGAIATARAHYGGALTYAARWPEEARVVPFWSELDAVGFAFYPDLEANPAPRDAREVQVLAFLFEQRLDALAAFAEEQERPALLMELGFRSTRLATRESELGPGPADPAAQPRAYQALARALRNVRAAHPGLAGMFLWNWSLDPLAQSDPARSFSPRGKPAEAALRAMYR